MKTIRSSWMARAAVLVSLLMSAGCITPQGGERCDESKNDCGEGGAGGSTGNGSGASGGEGATSGSGGSGAAGGVGSGGGGSCDPSLFMDLVYGDQNGIVVDGELVFHQVKFSSDGSYQREMIIGISASSFWCDWGTWSMADGCVVQFQSQCGASMEESISSDGSTMVLNGVNLQYNEFEIWSCAPTKCH